MNTYINEIKIRRIINKPFWETRILVKKILLISKIRQTSYCKSCGIDVRDFSVEDEEMG